MDVKPFAKMENQESDMKLRINNPMKYDSSTKAKNSSNKIPSHYL